MKKILIFIGLLIPCFLHAQYAGEYKIGIKAGLNIGTIYGSSEQDGAGNKVESVRFMPGFHVGPSFKYAATDNFGFIGELLFSQMNGKYRYGGSSFQIVNLDFGGGPIPVVVEGDKKIALNVTNSYLQFPLNAYFKITPNIEFTLGVSPSILTASSARGDLTFDGSYVVAGAVVDLDEININLDYNYNKDEAGGVASEETNAITSGGFEIPGAQGIPAAIGAYYEETEKDGRYFKAFDLGAIMGVSYVFDTGLHFGLRVHHSLLDVTNNRYDFSKTTYETENGAPVRVSREDRDSNLSFQLSIGFGF